MGSGDGDRTLRLRLNRLIRVRLFSSFPTEAAVVWDDKADSSVFSRFFLRNIEVTVLSSLVLVPVADVASEGAGSASRIV